MSGSSLCLFVSWSLCGRPRSHKGETQAPDLRLTNLPIFHIPGDASAQTEENAFGQERPVTSKTNPKQSPESRDTVDIAVRTCLFSAEHPLHHRR